MRLQLRRHMELVAAPEPVQHRRDLSSTGCSLGRMRPVFLCSTRCISWGNGVKTASKIEGESTKPLKGWELNSQGSLSAQGSEIFQPASLLPAGDTLCS